MLEAESNKYHNSKGNRDHDEEYYYDDDEEEYYDDEEEYYDEDDEQQEDNTNRNNTNMNVVSPKPKTNTNTMERSEPKELNNKEKILDADPKISANNKQDAKQQKQTNKISLYNFQPILKATYRELKNFVINPCPLGVTVRCYIERNRTGTKMLSPFYSICADLEDGTGRELMVCRKIMQSRTAHYIFSLKSDDLWRKREQRSRLFLGKLRAVNSNEYVLYDNGICAAPEDSYVEDSELGTTVGDDRNTVVTKKMEKDSKGTEDVSLYRRELAVIHFNTKTRPPAPGVRGTEVCIPKLLPGTPISEESGSNTNTSSADAKQANRKDSTPVFNIVKPFEKLRSTGRQNDMFTKTCIVLHERTSRYDPLSSCLVDFKGRANMASVKNCQFVESSPVVSSGGNEAMQKLDSEKDFALQLGKTTDDCFNMDFRHPLSLLQAFAISISRFDANLSW